MLSVIRHFARPITLKVTNNFTKRNVNFLHKNPVFSPISSASLYQHNLQILRYKSKGKSKVPQKQSDSESEEDSDWEDQITDKSSKVMKINVNSLRIDGLLKSSLGIARNKIEKLFYQSKIRLNGDKVLKKSSFAQEGDEIDIVRGASPQNPEFLTVARVEVLAVTGKDENLSVKIRRCKSLTIENYDDKWRPTTET